MELATFYSHTAAGSSKVAAQRTFTVHAQIDRVVTICTLTLHLGCISSSDNQAKFNGGWATKSNTQRSKKSNQIVLDNHRNGQ
jgi:hypothetical protein